MISYVTIRLIRIVATMLGVVTLTFVLGRVSGDPVALMLPMTATDADIASERATLGLDQPLLQQYVLYVSSLLRGDLGTSISLSRPASEVVLERLPATLALGIPALIASVLFGLGCGMLVAYRHGGPLDRALMGLSLAGQSIPAFVLGIGLILIFGVALHWLPTFGSDTWRHYLLPTSTLAIYPFAIILRLTRASILEVLGEDYVRTARAKGARERRVLFIHILRNAATPVLTVIGLQIAAILSGAAIVETVFSWPGIGALAVGAIGGRDYPVVQAVVLVSAAGFALSNLVVDILYTVVDPRIRQQNI